MCDVCKAAGTDSELLNGPDKSGMQVRKLFKVYKDGPARITVCYYHDMQLFLLGEKNFLIANRKFMIVLSQNRSQYSTAA